MSERAARAQLADSASAAASLGSKVVRLKARLAAASDEAATQRAVNAQLMARKQEVEWQLLTALAQVCAAAYVVAVWRNELRMRLFARNVPNDTAV
jgi:hypothetical protein